MNLYFNLNWVKADELMVTHFREYSLAKQQEKLAEFILPSEVVLLLGVTKSPSLALY